MLISLLFQNPLVFLFLAMVLIVSLAIHEFAHAYASDKLGDPTAKSLGRLTLNPLAHLDPVGTLLMLVAGFGWGKPVPFNPMYLKNPKRDAAIISFAGPFANFVIALVFILLTKLLVSNLASGNIVLFIAALFKFAAYYNIILGVFNLIPLHPLDGFKVVNGLLPGYLSVQWVQMAPYGIFVLLFLVFTNFTGNLLGVVANSIFKLFGI